MAVPQNLLLILMISGINLLSSSCMNLQEQETVEENPIARVGSEYLYYNDISKMLGSDMASEDSSRLVSNYVDRWLKQKLILKKAEANLTESQKNVSKELNEYRNSLIRYRYEQKIISNFLDTNISDEEIETYYIDHKRNFLLKENIVKAVYVKVGKDAPKLNNLEKWYKSDRDEDRVALTGYCHQYARDFYLDDESWIPFQQLIRRVPVRTFDPEAFLRSNRYIELEDSLNLYFVNIRSFKIKESVSPLDFERENIRSMIINKRKRDLIDRMENDIFQNGVKNKEFEIFNRE